MTKVPKYSCILALLFESCYCGVLSDMLDELGSLFDEDIDIQQNFGFDLIFPGTKWCGAGDVASNYNDLGDEREADICCRAHDHCPDLIPGGGTKYNLTNGAFYTRVHCDCDDKFLKCLRSADTHTATIIGIIYFDMLQTKCFRKGYQMKKCNKNGGLLRKKCVKYSHIENSDKIYRWFDVKDF